ncbi:ribosome biogenesis GTPase Der [candidate division KSB1 bacterium]|nr:ribosome biogenesis GTPase Der [candidate division KSB1 bacterium]
MKHAVVAILGRPNVGKSTFFNRLIRKREAIVDDQPGVTRDRKYAMAEWAGTEFELMDTGGWVPESKDVFENAIRQQVNYALREAQLIIFITDVTTGVTPMDEEIAAILRQSGVPVLLGVNKVDNEKRELELNEFYTLSLGEPHPISAISGRGIGDFLDKVIADLPIRQIAEEEKKGLRLAVLGRPNVGKSSYVNALLNQEKLIVTDIPGTTRDSIDSNLLYKGQEIVLVDTAGLRKRQRVKESIEYFSTVRTHAAIRSSDVAILLIDAVQGLADQEKKIFSELAEAKKGIVIGVNKWDLIEKDTHTARNFERDLIENVRDFSYLPIHFISAKTRQRVTKLLDTAIAVWHERKRTVTTSELNRFLQAAIEQNHPPAMGSKWIKINYMTQTHSAPPVFTFFTNEPKGIKANYRNYLENRFREQFGFVGVPLTFRFRKKN